MKISAVVLTKNEEQNIEKCLSSLRFCEEIIVIDDYSTDKTIELAKKYTPNIFQRELKHNFSEQRNFGLKKAKNVWVLFIDADEDVSKELQEELKNIEDIHQRTAYSIRRRDFFWGKEMKYGELQKVRNKGLIRLCKKDSGRWEGTVHEEFRTEGATRRLQYFINHYPHPTLKEFIHSVNVYSTLRAQELYAAKKKFSIVEAIVYPLGKFLYSYIVKLGFLDGPEGFIYSFLMSFHSFLVRVKLYQYYIENTKSDRGNAH